MQLRTWASEGFFPAGGAKVVKFVFSHSKLRKQAVFAVIFKIHPPSDAHG